MGKAQYRRNREAILAKYKAMRKQQRRDCPICKKAFLSVHNTKYCSPECRQKARANQAAEAYRADPNGAEKATKRTAERRRLARVDRHENQLKTGEASKLLGVSQVTVQEWIKQGLLSSTKVNRHNLLDRAEVEALAERRQGNTDLLRVVRTSGEFVIPKGFDVIKTYEELSKYTEGFAKGIIGFLLLCGPPGTGKSRQIKADLNGRCVWIDNHAANLGLYCAVYEAENRPVVLDDVNYFFSNRDAVSLMKSLTQTEDVRSVSWESTVRALKDRNVPPSYTTKSPICFIANYWNASNVDMAAVQDRSLPVAFVPTDETIYKRVVELGWCKDKAILAFIRGHLGDIPQHSMRDYYNAQSYKRMGVDWRKKLLTIWGLI
jgi:excisionase family DNA binding protein